MDVLGKGWGYGILAADILKGVVACAVGRRLAGGTGAHVAGTAAVVGHCFPVWKRLPGRQGRGREPGPVPGHVPRLRPGRPGRGVGRRQVVGTGPARHRGGVGHVGGGRGVVAWRRWPNLWGPPPTAALPLASAVSSAVILYKFATAKRPPMIGIVTDSNSQIPPELAARLGIEVVPLTVTVDGVAYREGVDIDADDFYARFESGTPAGVHVAAEPGRVRRRLPVPRRRAAPTPSCPSTSARPSRAR